MIQFILTVVQDGNKDEEIIERIDQIIDDEFDNFIASLMQDYGVNYHSSVDWGYDDSSEYEEE
jgi:hypothetical protein